MSDAAELSPLVARQGDVHQTRWLSSVLGSPGGPLQGHHRRSIRCCPAYLSARPTTTKTLRNFQPLRRAGHHHRKGDRLGALAPPRDRCPRSSYRPWTARFPATSTYTPCPTTPQPTGPPPSSAGSSTTPVRRALHPDQLAVAELGRAVVRFSSSPRSCAADPTAQRDSSNTGIRNWNENPRPFVWTKTTEEILESIARYCTRINESRHYGMPVGSRSTPARVPRLACGLLGDAQGGCGLQADEGRRSGPGGRHCPCGIGRIAIPITTLA